jgi:hypothetical protein
MATVEKIHASSLIDKALAFKKGTSDEQTDAASKSSQAAQEFAKALVGPSSSDVDNIARVFDPGFFNRLMDLSVPVLETIKSSIKS